MGPAVVVYCLFSCVLCVFCFRVLVWFLLMSRLFRLRFYCVHFMLSWFILSISIFQVRVEGLFRK